MSVLACGLLNDDLAQVQHMQVLIVLQRVLNEGGEGLEVGKHWGQSPVNAKILPN